MKREREGGGKVQAEKEWGARSGQDTLSPTRFLRSQRRRPTKVHGGRPDKVTPRAPTLVSLTLEGPEVHKIVTKGNIHSAHRDLLRTPGPVYSLSANIEQGAVIT